VTVAIVTDSAAALPADVVDALGVTVVPMWLQLDGTAHHEDEVDLDELIVHRDISTSGPTPGEFEAVLRDRATGRRVPAHDLRHDEAARTGRGARCGLSGVSWHRSCVSWTRARPRVRRGWSSSRRRARRQAVRRSMRWRPSPVPR
jgi:hypothetical protein